MQNNITHILVIEDDPDLGTMIKMMLEYKHYQVTLLQSVKENLEQIIDEQNISMVIMDMLLSGANGTDICSALKKNPNTKHIPVMMISAHPNAKEISKAAGADGFVSKPFEMQDFLSAVEGFTTNR